MAHHAKRLLVERPQVGEVDLVIIGYDWHLSVLVSTVEQAGVQEIIRAWNAKRSPNVSGDRSWRWHIASAWPVLRSYSPTWKQAQQAGGERLNALTEQLPMVA